MEDKKVAVIGLDGMYWELLDFLITKGYMPFLRSKNNYASRKKLISTDPPYTPLAWTSITTGVNPIKHRIYGFFKFNPRKSKIELTNAKHLKYPRIWEMLFLKGKRSIIINVPFIEPTKVQLVSNYDVLIPGWESVKKDFHPVKIKELIMNFSLLKYPNQWWDILDYADDIEYLKQTYELLHLHIKGYKELIEHNDNDFLFVVFSEPDWIMHRSAEIHFFQLNDYHKKIFKEIDDFIKFVYKKYDYILILSDHGFKIYNKVIFINNLLHKVGLLKFDIIHELIYNIFSNRLFSGLLRMFFGSKRSNKNKEINYPKYLNQDIGLRMIINYIKPLVRYIKRGKINTKESLAFSTEYGIIYKIEKLSAQKKYRRVLEFLEKNYISVDYDDGYKILLPRISDIYIDSSYDLLGTIADKYMKPDHKKEGIFIILDKDQNIDLRPDSSINTTDIVPTILDLYDLPKPSHVDGESIIITRKAKRKEDYLRKWKITKLKKKIKKEKI